MSPLEGTVPRQTGKQWLAGSLLIAMIGVAATGLLALPIAAATGEWGLLLGVFFGTLVLTTTVAATLSFSTPLNYQTNLMVYGPGKYRFSDFTRVGVPLQLALSVVAVAVIRWAWPLTAA